MATSNSLTAAGISIKSLEDILTDLRDGMRAIYGDDINLDPNTPDGQMLNLVAQMAVDHEELIRQIYNSFNPDAAVGISLDDRCALNGVIRAGGTYTQQPVEITVDRALTLQGLDTSTTPFTVQDAAGTQYQLVSSHAFSGAGVASLVFQAVEPGAVTSGLNTITTQTTVLLGVVSVNNSADASSVGVAQETDLALRVRRAKSVAIPSQGYLDGLLGSLLALAGVTQAEVFENVTASTDLRGIPGHSIWAIVAGGVAADIADVIYRKRSLGCGMKGSTTVDITQLDGLVQTISFDRPLTQNLWIQFDVEAMTGVIDLAYLRSQLIARLSYGIFELADSSGVVALVKEIYPNASVSNEGVSKDGVTYTSLEQPDTVQHQFTVYQIDINGTVS